MGVGNRGNAPSLGAPKGMKISLKRSGPHSFSLFGMTEGHALSQGTFRLVLFFKADKRI